MLCCGSNLLLFSLSETAFKMGEKKKTQLNMILTGHSTATLDFSIKIQGTEMHDSIR